MRIRSIKPEFWRSPDISCLRIEDRLLFIGIWSYVDDNGVGEDRVSMIAADLFADDLAMDPRDTLARVSDGLERLSAAGRIVRYRVAGRDFLEVTNWSKHQRIDRPGKARHPRHDAEGAVIRDTLATPSRDPIAWNRGTGDQGTGDQGTGEQAHAAGVLAIDPGPDLDSLFDHAYAEWPKKVNRKQASEKFKRACRKRDPHELVEDIARFGRAYAATTDRQFVPGLDVWINNERWTDELPQPRQQTPVKQPAMNRALDEFQRLYGGDDDAGTGRLRALDVGGGA